MTISRRRFLGLTATGLLLAACGTSTSATPAPASTTTAAPAGAGARATPASTTVATTLPAAPAPTATIAPTAAAAPTQPAGTRLVAHAMGETRVPASPQRLVVLDTGELDSALALGITPVGATTVFQDGDVQAYLTPMTATVKKVGTIEQPNLETIAALRPDLILSSKLRHEKIYDKLAQIAPTVFTETVGVAWKENLMVHAEALGKRAEAEQLMAAYRGRLEDFTARLGPRREQTQVSILRSFPDHVRLYMKASFIGTILQDAGLPRPPAQDQDTFADRVTTKEALPAMDGDVIFIMHFSPDKGSLLTQWMNDPLWQTLKAVKAGRVYEVPDDTWALGIGILAANRVLDDLFTYLMP